MRRSRLIRFILPIALVAAKAAHGEVLWQIGKFDQSPVEFTRKPAKDIAFDTRTSDAAKDWPARLQTGDVYRISFPLDSHAGAFLLKVNALIERPRVPALRVNVNGHAGRFYLHPKLSYSRSDFTYAFDPHESQSMLEMEIPDSFLKSGDNTIALECVDDPSTPPNQEELGGISFDAVSLERTSQRASGRQTEIQAEPTIFFRGDGKDLTERVYLFIRRHHFGKPSVLELDIAGKRYTSRIAAAEFGEQRVSLDLPEWTGTIAGSARLTGDAKSRREFKLTAQRKWTIYVVPHTHLDVGYTDYQGKIAETQPRVLSQAENLIREHPDFRFSMDGSWNLEQLLATRSATKQEEIINLIRSGKMAMPVQYCNLLTGYASLETLYRSLYVSKDLARRYNLPFEYANITDVPTYSGSYPSILASSGVKYWVAASNNDRAPVFFYDHWNEKSPFWWQGPDGKKVLFWYSRHYEHVQTLFGLPPQLEAVQESLPIYLQAYSQPSYKPDIALLYGTQVENTDLVPSTAVFADDWNKRYTFPKLAYATFADFFHYIDAKYGSELPVYKGDGSGYWEDGIGSDAYFAAEDRKNQNRALSAEVLSSVAHSVDPDLNPPAGVFADIWRNIILFAEHTWLSYNSVSQPDHEQSIKQLRVKDDRAERASLEIENVMDRSLSQLADQIHIPANTLVVFNSLNWKRDALVETDLFEHPELTDLTTHQSVPLQVLYTKEKFLHVRFLAKDLPAVGYKCFAITYKDRGAPERINENTRIIENTWYRITVDGNSGAIASIFDKDLQREIVDEKSSYKFGQYLYVTGGDGDTQMINPFPALPPGVLTVHPSEKGQILRVEKLPWGQSVHLKSSALNTPTIETEVLLLNNQKKIQLTYRVNKEYTTKKEGVYFAFPANVSSPHFRYASQQGWIDPAKDILKGGSLEWFNVQQWMEVNDGNLAVGIVPLDEPLASFGDINRGTWPGEFKPESGTIFSYVMNNYWHTNYRAAQGGQFTFRYVVTSSKQLDGGALNKLGLEEMRPVEVNYVVPQDKVGNPPRPLAAEGQSFLEAHADNIALITWKKAEEGNGSILRLQELAGRASELDLHLSRNNIRSAQLCSGVEDPLEQLAATNGTVHISFQPFEVKTIRVQ